MYDTLKAGQNYIETLPNQKKLNVFMPDYRFIKWVKFAQKVMPAFACFAIIWQYFLHSPTQFILVNVLITALFALSIPFQGLFWLGRRAKSPLSLSLLKWYEELRIKLMSEQIDVEEQMMPSYQDFATLLKLAEQTWGDQYFDEL
ncbi:terminus macrodomain insulation protein YfbV [Pasteurella atlantica]|uniref:Terminus macrodomain insulation protein YfbV n=2 Tax=Pasteurellaceae TaxID=712 RepID=A0ACC6HMA9_9PAST|nr:terminus macrodomain insulation protein YfbV [Pasteurella atlantica]MDP8051953.1 terminus macrodomain insulation protein YfbV [Pasteurella atlantica]MDP8105528.1 terminus macrodomain insulation protein YfbV [Pasteurella atlantica]MDP8148861.1 terminus macrodomain insulation protein YfbV [Pasteurella atlantica]